MGTGRPFIPACNHDTQAHLLLLLLLLPPPPPL
jgi:hypothetical protein